MAQVIEAKKHTYLSFHLCGEIFAIEVSKVLKVLRNQEITFVPKTKPFISGIINFHGEIVTVIQTKQKFNMNYQHSLTTDYIIVVDLTIENNDLRIGLIADRVSDVIQVSQNQLVPVPEFGSQYNPNFVEGSVEINGDFVKILNIEKIFDKIENE